MERQLTSSDEELRPPPAYGAWPGEAPAAEARTVVVDDVDEDQLPRAFGRYLLLGQLSQGGMGEIFFAKLGELEGFEKLVIIKRVRPQFAADKDFITRFVDEAKLAIALRHANIAQVVEVGRVEGQYFIAIDHIDGCDLRRVLRRLDEREQQLSIELGLFIVRELLNGLAYAHRRTDADGKPLELVHRDISPPNTMVSFDGEVKIIDFGLARTTNRLASTQPGIGFGKFGYMAPEQLTAGAVLDRRTDLYAVGVMLYELLTGDLPFPFENQVDYFNIAAMVTEGKLTPPLPSSRNPLIDPELDAILLKALARLKEDRYQDAEAFRDAIQAKLVALNPTTCSDTLALRLRELFAAEIAEQRQKLVGLMSIDVAPYRDELLESTERHTITFARALLPAPEIEIVQVPAPAVETLGARLSRHRPVLLLGLAAYVAMIVGALLVLGGARFTSVTPVVADVSTPAKPAILAPAPPTPPAIAVAPARTVRVASQPSRALVTNKYLAVKDEYASFRVHHGSVLKDQWRAVTHQVAFGRGHKLVKLNAMLDSLRRAMRRERGRASARIRVRL